MKIRNTEFIHITIPAYKEEFIQNTLESVLKCSRIGIQLKISVLINASEQDESCNLEINDRSYNNLVAYIELNSLHEIISVHKRLLPAKHAGVGLARKTLMDAAALEYRDRNLNGIIVALDADCVVAENYLMEIEKFFQTQSFEAASICFEHPINDEREDYSIIEYEWHLRYFIEMQRLAGFPFAIHTVGSSMAVLSETYLSKGGMNRRKAGEDFYFMHKFIKDQVCGELNSTIVYPSGRTSDRVPFGTGRAIGKYREEAYVAQTYNPECFMILQKWNCKVKSFYKDRIAIRTENLALKSYLVSIQFAEKLESIVKNTSTEVAFLKRFYQFFDAFQLMKCLHYMRGSYPDIDILDSMNYYSQQISQDDFISPKESLLAIRTKQKSF